MNKGVVSVIIAGVVSCWTSALAATIAFPMPGLDEAKKRSEYVTCAHSLTGLVRMAFVWSMDNENHFPASFQELLDPAAPVSLLYCPANVSWPTPTNQAGIDWSKVDYEWIPLPNWDNPSDICCQCRVHNQVAYSEGTVHRFGTYRTGWPEIIAAPIDQYATPGADVRFEVKVAPDAQLPLQYQWRREALYYVTNVVFVENPEVPRTGSWVTNVLPAWTVTLLPGETNPVLQLSGVSTNDSGFYSIAVSNAMGTAASRQAMLRVDADFESYATNEASSAAVCANNLKQIRQLAGFWAQDVGFMPLDLSEMVNAYNLPFYGWPTVLYCRADTARVAPADWTGVDFSNTSYELPGGNPHDPLDVFCRCKVHGFYAQVNGDIMLGPRMTGIRILPDNVVELSFRLFAGRANVIEASSDLVHWIEMATYPSITGEFSLYELGGLPSRFYRIRLQ